VKETVEKTLEHMKSALDDICEQMRKFKCPSVAEVKTFDENISMNSSVVVKDLLVLDGTLDMKRVRVLKDDGCNTNVVSHEFFQKNKSCFKWKHCNVEVRHSEADSVEKSSQVVLGATVRIGKHSYKSNWLVANCRYDVLLGMPWHVANNPNID